MPWSSLVPEVMDYVIGLWRAVPTMPKVIDGPVIASNSLRECLGVGYQRDEATGASSTFVFEGLSPTPTRETLSILCSAAVLIGSGTTRTARLRAYQIVGLAGDAIAADDELGGLVLSARISAADLIPSQGRNGAQVTIPFAVECDAYTRR